MRVISWMFFGWSKLRRGKKPYRELKGSTREHLGASSVMGHETALHCRVSGTVFSGTAEES